MNYPHHQFRRLGHVAAAGSALALLTLATPLIAGAQTVSTTTSTSTASTTGSTASSSPVISGITAAPADTSATIAWTTDVPADTQISFGTSTPQDMFTGINGTLTTGHSVTLTNLTPNTLYQFEAISSANGNRVFSPAMSFTTTGSTTSTGTTSTTTTGTGTSTSTLSQANLQALLQQIFALLAQLQAMLQMQTTGGSTGGVPGTTIIPTGGNMSGMITSNNTTVRMGTGIDFGGRGFGHEETVTITNNGATVGTAHADGGGNFSTGSLQVPNIIGPQTYTFTGQTSGITGSVTIQVAP